jgi:hypothetical protein
MLSKECQTLRVLVEGCGRFDPGSVDYAPITLGATALVSIVHGRLQFSFKIGQFGHNVVLMTGDVAYYPPDELALQVGLVLISVYRHLVFGMNGGRVQVWKMLTDPSPVILGTAIDDVLSCATQLEAFIQSVLADPCRADAIAIVQRYFHELVNQPHPDMPMNNSFSKASIA